MRKRWLAPAILILVAGCATIPFQRPELPSLPNPDPAAIRESFARSLPDKFTADATVIIDAPFRDEMAILAVIGVDRIAGTFQLVGLNHMGVQIFHLSGDSEGVQVRAAIPPLMKQKRILLSIGRDFRAMYFDLVPRASAKASKCSRIVRFTANTSGGRLIHDFGGDPALLLEKRLKGFIRTKWRVRYFEYENRAGKLHPRGIIMNNGRYFYRLVVKNRQWQVK